MRNLLILLALLTFFPNVAFGYDERCEKIEDRAEFDACNDQSDRMEYEHKRDHDRAVSEEEQIDAVMKQAQENNDFDKEVSTYVKEQDAAKETDHE